MKKYLDIYRELRKQIDAQQYLPGCLLPSEHVLALRYQTTRETVRKALKELEMIGYIQKKQGKGSFIIDRNRYRFPVGKLTSFHELELQENMDTETRIVQNEVISAPDFLVQAGLVQRDEKVIFLIRQRIINQKPMILDKDYLRMSSVPFLSNQIAKYSLYEYLEKELKLPISYAQKEFVGERVTEEDKQYLAVKSDTHVMVVRSDVYLEDNTFLQYTESRHCLDKFRFVEFARRSV